MQSAKTPRGGSNEPCLWTLRGQSARSSLPLTTLALNLSVSQVLRSDADSFDIFLDRPQYLPITICAFTNVWNNPSSRPGNSQRKLIFNPSPLSREYFPTPSRLPLLPRRLPLWKPRRYPQPTHYSRNNHWPGLDLVHIAKPMVAGAFPGVKRDIGERSSQRALEPRDQYT